MDDDELFADLAARLRDAHRTVPSFEVSDDEKACITRRLLAIGEVSKQDLRRASTRLDAFVDDLEAGWRPHPSDPEGP